MNFPLDDVKQLLIACADALSKNNMDDFNNLIALATNVVSVRGEAIEQVGIYLIQGLLAKALEIGKSENYFYDRIRDEEVECQYLRQYKYILSEICPILNFCYWAANCAIAGAMRDEEQIHIIDFKIGHGFQWEYLIEELAARPGGAPHVRITGIDDPVSLHARHGEGFEEVEAEFIAMSVEHNIEIEFNGLPVFAPMVTHEMLDLRPGEALAVSLPLKLHHYLDGSVDVKNPADTLLTMVRSLSPKIFTLMEPELNTSNIRFLDRFKETLAYYLALFESIDENIIVQKYCLAREIVNLIACEEDKNMVLRHECFTKWSLRLKAEAGFSQYPLPADNPKLRSMHPYPSSGHYTVVEEDGAVLLNWKGRNLISASAWRL